MSTIIKTIFWDFDGVIMDSNAVRDKGFELTLAEFPYSQVQALLNFHKENGGLSRYVKFRYFFEAIRGEQITEAEIYVWASRFSDIVKKELLNPGLLIQPILNFIKENKSEYHMHIVSGSDQEELRYICGKLEIDDCFISIQGSPKPKTEWVKDLLDDYSYDKNQCVLIGDSINDFEAAQNNEISFKGYNNPTIEQLTNIDFPL